MKPCLRLSLFTLLPLVLLTSLRAATEGTLTNEAKSLRFTWHLDHGNLSYEVDAIEGDGKLTRVVESSPLGLQRSDSSFTGGLVHVSSSVAQVIDENYHLLVGKKREVHHRGILQTLSFENAEHQPITVDVQLSDTWVAFRYGFPTLGKSQVLLTGETTGFHIPAKGQAWMLPYDKVAIWAPSYEAEWKLAIPIGTTAPSDAAGWAFPALFRTTSHWVLLSEAGIDGTCYASHLEAEASNGLYRIRLPEAEETYGVAPREATLSGPWHSPWRVMIIGKTPAPLVETTAITDLSAPNEIKDTSWIRPGRVSWSWWSDKGSPSDYNRLVPFIDLSSDYGWEYSLIDLGWESMKRGTVAQLADYAKKENVGLILWYNSGGAHNRVDGGVRDVMADPVLRKNEMARIAALGVKGIKVDFMQSDKQYLMQLYIDILRDAAAAHLFVDFHGATTPRGWSRTFPNLLTQEAVRGVEQYWDSNYAEKNSAFNTLYTFTRNVVGSMDYTPVIFGDAPELERHQNSNAHELALSVAFESGLQHFVDSVSAYRIQPDYVQQFLSKVPAVWDDLRYLDGTPGELSLLARRHGDDWYVACLNGENTAKEISVAFSFLPAGTFKAELIADGKTQRTFEKKDLTLNAADTIKVPVLPKGGFVLHLTKG